MVGNQLFYRMLLVFILFGYIRIINNPLLIDIHTNCAQLQYYIHYSSILILQIILYRFSYLLTEINNH